MPHPFRWPWMQSCEWARKAFIAVDGVSLTVAATGDGWFEIALIPETIERTTLRARPPGSRVNLEVDPIARYVSQCHPEPFDGAQGRLRRRATE